MSPLIRMRSRFHQVEFPRHRVVQPFLAIRHNPLLELTFCWSALGRGYALTGVGLRYNVTFIL